MTRAVYVIGPPGSGRTTLVNRLLADLPLLPPVTVWADPHTRLFGQPFLRKGPGGDTPSGILLGHRRDPYGGTDALSAAVNPVAVAWANHPDGAQRWAAVVGEGRRLANVAFLTALAAHTDLTVIRLNAPTDTLIARASTHPVAGEKPLTGMVRVARLVRQLHKVGIPVQHIETHEVSPDLLVSDVHSMIGGPL